MEIKRDKVIYWVATALLSLFMLMSIGMYFFKNDMVSETFAKLGYPTYIIYPLAVAKLLALIAILTKKSKTLKEWAYAGLFFDFVLAFFAHFMAKDGGYIPAIVAVVLLFVSYCYDRKIWS